MELSEYYQEDIGIMKETQGRFFINVNCPQCGIPNKYEILETIYSNVHLQAKQRLFNNTLFEYKCEHCKTSSDMLYEIVYYNMQCNTILYFVEHSRIANACASIDYVDQDTNMKWPDIVLNCKKRVVDHPMILREKALILEYDMDDRIIEILKVIYVKGPERVDDYHPERILFDIDHGEICFKIFNKNETIITTFPEKAYDYLERKYKDVLSKNKDYVIDRGWAINFISEHNLNYRSY